MRSKKHLLSTLIIGVILTSVFLNTSISEASIATPGRYLKIENPTYRNSSYAYKVGIESQNNRNQRRITYVENI